MTRDHNPPRIVYGGKEFEYALLGRGIIGQAQIWYSPGMTLTRPEIAAEMRAIADWVEFGVQRNA